jgi:hypothetical protein
MCNPKGNKNKDDFRYGSKSVKPQTKELNFMPLGITSQNKFYLEQYLKSFPSDTICVPCQLPAFSKESVFFSTDKGGMIHMLYIYMCTSVHFSCSGVHMYMYSCTRKVVSSRELKI